MKLKKGFTLVEMLAVVVLIGLLVVITVPSIKTIMNNAKEKSLERQIASIIESSKSWSIENIDMLPDNNVPILVSLSELKEQGFLEDKEIINPVNNKEITGCVEIKYDIDFNQYKYNYKDNCELEMPDEILISSISLNTTSVSIINGGTYQIEASISPSSATNKNLKYTSNNANIVSVSDAGLIIGISGGETTITVSTIDGSNISEFIEVIVREQISNVELDITSASIDVGESVIVNATIIPSNAYIKTLKWESNNESVATVNDGIITGVGPGEAVITATTQDGTSIENKINVTVKRYSITYNTNGGTLPSNVITSYHANAETFNLPTPTRNGYTFNGWYESEDLSGNPVTQITKGTKENKVYYAKWTVMPLIIYDNGIENLPLSFHVGYGASYNKYSDYIDCYMDVYGTYAIDITVTTDNIDLSLYTKIYADITLAKYGANNSTGRTVFKLGIGDVDTKYFSNYSLVTLTSATAFRQIVSLDITDINDITYVGCGIHGQTYNGGRFYLHKIWLE